MRILDLQLQLRFCSQVLYYHPSLRHPHLARHSRVLWSNLQNTSLQSYKQSIRHPPSSLRVCVVLPDGSYFHLLKFYGPADIRSDVNTIFPSQTSFIESKCRSPVSITQRPSLTGTLYVCQWTFSLPSKTTLFSDIYESWAAKISHSSFLRHRTPFRCSTAGSLAEIS